MELLVACVFAYWLMRHGPQLVAEAIAELEFARRGEMSPLAEARLKRLLDAGIDPAFGGPMRQFFGNAWRDLWRDLDEQRAQRRTGPTDGGRGWSFRGWFDDVVTRKAERWRRRQADNPDHDDGPGWDGDNAPGWADDPSGPGFDPDEFVPAPEPSAHDHPTPGPQPEPEPVEPPVRVPSETGEPIRDPATPAQPETERTTDVSHPVVAVTGVVSGAAEARAIQRQVDAAAAAFQAAMRAVRSRIVRLGEQAVGEVEQAVHSRVVAALAQGAEAAAAAEADAKRCAAEVGPQMGIVARHFDRLNS